MVLFWHRADLRRRMLVMGLLIMPFGPVSEYFYFKDWWHPETFNGWQYGLEDVLFAFLIGGVSSIFYEELVGRQFINKHLPRHPLSPIIFSGIVLVTLFVLTRSLGINSSYTSDIAFLIITVIMVYLRRDLIKNALVSGVVLTVLATIIYMGLLVPFPELFKKYWYLNNFTGLNIFGIPAEELSWFFFWGMVAGIFYEFVTGFGDRKLPSYNKKRT